MSPAVTDDALLGGRLRYRQFLDGYRTGIEPVLLAAAVPARAGHSVLEAGCGAGAALLCLSSRVPGVIAHGIEADAETLEVARWNMRSNGFDARLHQAVLPRLPADGLPDGPDPRQPGRASFDHILCNPPWHRGNATASPMPKRDLARRAAGGLLGEWIAVLAPLLVPGGSFSLILPAALHAEACAALLRGGLVGGIALLPFWPRVGRPAKIVLLQGRRGSRAPSTILPGLLLHGPGGVYSADAERILRDGAALELQRWSPGR